jgi:hypothetical protein
LENILSGKSRNNIILDVEVENPGNLRSSKEGSLAIGTESYAKVTLRILCGIIPIGA